ncbi:MAG TPA: outer membrane beta-barrel protein [Candidatus Methylacidiphilales bacterium]|nr:outer membrane beta-barrel protein [Candidatus Methylacidiphilales bacterium]
MKAILKAFGAVVLSGAMALPVLADDSAPATTSTNDSKDVKDLKKVVEDQGINYVETAQKGITLSGYVDTSYTEQFGGKGTAFGSGQALLHQFDVNNNSFNVNAVKIALEKALPSDNVWAAGFRIDTMYGQDAKILSASDPVLGSAGSSVYLEQALVKVNIPVGNGLQIYMGKFVTLLGYEVIESPANPNFSRGLLFTNAIPLTNTGIYADYKFNSTLEAKFGIVDGWNQSDSTPNAFPPPHVGNGTDLANDYPFGGKAITGQLVINAPGGNANITQSFIYSPSGEPANPGAISGTSAESFSGAPDDKDNGPVVVYDIWGNWNPTFVKDSALTLGFNVDFGYNGASGAPVTEIFPGGTIVPGADVQDSNTWYGVALYSQYKLSKLITLAARGEYLHEDSAFNPKFGVPGVSNDDFSETLTASFNIWDNLLTRVEYRYDHLTNGSTGAFGGPNNVATYTNQDEVAVEAVYSF